MIGKMQIGDIKQGGFGHRRSLARIMHEGWRTWGQPADLM
jgi:hypothetical protein